jgi:membrane protease YdiL (CAAX protease family)
MGRSYLNQGEYSMRIPVRFAPIVFGALLSMIMVAIVSAFVLATTDGIHAGFVAKWLRSCVTTWPVAFVVVTLVAPLVRRVVARVTG